jgi:hypothetical protein
MKTKHSTTAYRLAQNELDRQVRENFGQMPRNDPWVDSVLDLCDALEVLAKTEQTEQEPLTEAQIEGGLMALLQCSASDLESYSYVTMDNYTNDVKRVVSAVNQLQPQLLQAQEPVAWMVTFEKQNGARETVPLSGRFKDVKDACDFGEPIPLYKSPPKLKEWVGLTDEEVQAIHDTYYRRMGFREFHEHIEAKLKELNHD